MRRRSGDRAGGGIPAPETSAPTGGSYRGHEIVTPPPPSGGITMLEILKTLECFDVASMKPFEAPYFHLFSEAAKLCWADRNRLVGDPDVVEVPIARMLSKEAANERATMLSERGISD